MTKTEDSRLDARYERLIDIIRGYGKVAVAFSGGVDSTLTLHAAVTALGAPQVLACYILSPLNSAAAIAGTRATFRENFPADVRLREVALDPLQWPEFVVNGEDRCYLCKKRMYTAIGNVIAADGFSLLADGTNCDDLAEKRPGLRAIRELQVRTPLADAGLAKADVRLLARSLGLSNFALPSNSCLATRIPHGRPISESLLALVDEGERFLQNRGFFGCRVRLDDSAFVIEIQEKDFVAFVETENRKIVQRHFQSLRNGPIFLNIRGR